MGIARLKTPFFSYLFFAAVATAVDFAVLYALTEFGKLFYLASAAISYACGMATNYALNKKYTFSNTSKEVAKQFSVFVLIALVGLGLNLLIMYALVEYLHIWYMLARLVSVFIVLIWSYTAHKKITFGVIR